MVSAENKQKIMVKPSKVDDVIKNNKPRAVAVTGTQEEIFELDELYWFINKKNSSETRENVYIITMVRRNPRQIINFSVS